MKSRRALYVFLSILALFLLGTVFVLSSVTYYLAIDPTAYLSQREVPILDNTTRWNASDHGHVQHIPRIIHQTWKTEVLPDRWKNISQECRDMMPDYEYMLWTDEGSRQFIAEYYPWFLDTFDGYKFNIQRADAIRYFVLHQYGGIYIDLDIGCLRPLDPLLVYPVILPKTIPVGISNDLIFSAKGHPFMEQTIHNLITFDISWILHYPTVMFSTGPMFLSAHIRTTDIRVLPKSLYGKNAKEGEAPDSFFSHFYGSSWHADDAAFIGFLGKWGKALMWIGLFILIVGIVRLPKQRRSLRRIGGYDVLIPRLSRSGRWHFHLGGSSSGSSIPSSPEGSELGSPINTDVPVLHLPLDVQPTSPVLESSDGFAGRIQSPIVDAFRRVRNRVSTPPRTPIRSRRQRPSRGYLFFLPAIFTQSQDIELDSSSSVLPRSNPPTLPQSLSRPHSRSSNYTSKSSAWRSMILNVAIVQNFWVYKAIVARL
ncbi:nucleotide-diphospho-sugar transferase [Cyathus striatus]|nr:nucleotide-diphospho-sugar transferase [Cyathus striatus]